jgi:glutamyl-tRNA synthetase
MVPPVRVRMAPSPTGYFHVGGARTALYNWLYARRNHGVFILRIEDTDRERNQPEWVDGIVSAMKWLGLDWDEGPFFQSEYAELHRAAGHRLHAEGRAYYCDCTRDQVEARKEKGATPGYDAFCADRGLEAGPGRALRFRVPRPGKTVVSDVIRGEVSFDHDAIDDFILLKSDGQPLFLLANVVDDMEMNVTHVIRGEEHLANTPKALMLWEALGLGTPPVFAHLPVLVNEKRQKLSKRRDPVAVEDYRDQGYLPEAMVNYLALLGWSPVDREILSLDDLVVEFRLEEVNNSPAFFDVAKLRHFNGEYIRELPVGRFIDLCHPWLEKGPWPPEAFDDDAFVRMAPLVQERVATLDEVPAMVDFLFLDDPPGDDAAWDKGVARAPHAGAILGAVGAGLADCPWDAGSIRQVIESAAEANGLKLAKAQAPVRVAITGHTVGPPLFESIEVLGRERAVARLEAALRRLA